ncbi:MAG: phosphoribosyl-AMP cyclohydrolase [Oscillospiraceae bacterium]|nr:phosphoribosyl-AMP cyclohydrolase [Oscillospiraceae bacterium]MDD7428187.1 phosphoribosyl-AMP cyclohydrolase [Oscillospiraceae bacterium]MDY2846976.1 phosphoribosyl-AMP cyclohydrolase [Oscillospiraceae bacterium]
MGLIEETNELMLDWNKIGSISEENKVIPVAVQNYNTKEVILVAYVNEEALKESIRLRKAVFWSTSRNKLWFKGAESGNTFTLKHIFVNCEQNSLVYQVTPDKGNICHTSYNGVANNCYYRELDMDTMKLINLNEIKKGE